MGTQAVRQHSTPGERARWLIAAFISGALGVLIFHQAALGLLHAAGLTSATPYGLAATKPFGLPQVWSLAFWGGVWGIVLAAALGRLRGASFIVAAIIFGAIAPTLVAWFVVAPLKGQALAAGWVPARMAIGPIVNGAWGLGTAIGLCLLGRRQGTRTA